MTLICSRNIRRAFFISVVDSRKNTIVYMYIGNKYSVMDQLPKHPGFRFGKCSIEKLWLNKARLFSEYLMISHSRKCTLLPNFEKSSNNAKKLVQIIKKKLVWVIPGRKIYLKIQFHIFPRFY